MEINKDIFDMKDINDLPEELKRNLSYSGLHEDAIKMIEIFRIKKELSVNEILIGMYRKFNIIKSRLWVGHTISNLKRRNLIKTVGKGKYELIKEFNEIE